MFDCFQLEKTVDAETAANMAKEKWPHVVTINTVMEEEEEEGTCVVLHDLDTVSSPVAEDTIIGIGTHM